MVDFYQDAELREASMGRTVQIGWRWLRLKLYQLRQGHPQALGDNFPFFPCTTVKVMWKLAQRASR